jgi:hypothetical protein
MPLSLEPAVRTPPNALAAAASLLLAAGGCLPVVETEGGQVRLTFDGARGAATGSYSESSPLLVGATYCHTLTCAADCPASDFAVEDCFDVQVQGAGTVDGDQCASIDATGEVEWRFEAVSCAANDDGYAPSDDTLHMQAVETSTVTASIEQWLELLAESELEPVGQGWPSGWTAEPGEALQVLAGATLRLPVVVRHPDFATPVVWLPDDASFELDQQGTADVELSQPTPGELALTTPLGSAATVTMDLYGQRFELGSVEAVEADTVQEVQVVVAAWFTDPDPGTQTPMGARAVLWADNGRPVLGAPVDWSVRRGALGVSGDPTLPGPDYVWLEDSCVAPDEQLERKVRLRASFEGHHDSVDLEWTGAQAKLDPDWQPGATCMDGGCGCQGGGSLPWTLAGSALALVGALRRRQRQQGTGAMTVKRG